MIIPPSFWENVEIFWRPSHPLSTYKSQFKAKHLSFHNSTIYHFPHFSPLEESSWWWWGTRDAILGVHLCIFVCSLLLAAAHEKQDRNWIQSQLFMNMIYWFIGGLFSDELNLEAKVESKMHEIYTNVSKVAAISYILDSTLD